MASDPDDHGPGCDGPLNCTCDGRHKAYQQGHALGASVEALRAAGYNPDCRWDIVDARKELTPAEFESFMEGLRDAMERAHEAKETQ